MKTKLLTLLLAGACSLLAQPKVSIGIQIGPGGRTAAAPYAYALPAPRAQIIPRSPGRNYVWVPGYWMQTNTRRGPQYLWQNGFWAQAPKAAKFSNKPGRAFRGSAGR